MPVVGVESHRTFGFVHVAAGDVEYAVCLTAWPLERHDRVGRADDSVGAGQLGGEVVGGHLA